MRYPVRFPLLDCRASRAWAVRGLLLAFSWYALAPLPSVVLHFLVHSHHAVHDSAAVDVHDHDHGLAHQDFDTSDIPGSPLHPADHDCFECQVLKYLARCILPDTAAPTVPALGAAPVALPTFTPSLHAGFAVPTPPIRAPPLATA